MQEQEKFILQSIADLREPVLTILDQLRRDVVRKKYGFILGEDNAGRIPALVIGRVINNYYRHVHSPALPVIFLQGVRTYDQSYDPEIMKARMTEAFEKRKFFLRDVDRAKKALVVTENVFSGSSMKGIGDILAADGWKFDIASLFASLDRKAYVRGHYIPRGTRLVLPAQEHDISALHGDSSPSGLNRKKYEEPRILNDFISRSLVRFSRGDIALLTRQLSQQFIEQMS